MSSASLRRAGLDYHDLTQVYRYARLDDYLATCDLQRMFAFSRFAGTCFSQARYQQGDSLLFGPETRGLPPEVLSMLPQERQLRVPMCAGNRSLNLANTVAVASYEAWRQLGYSGATAASKVV